MPVAAGTQLDPAATRAKVLDAATELFYARGIHAVGVNEISRAAGVSKLSLYRHFGSKDRLVGDVLAARSDRVHAWLVTELERSEATTPPGRVLAVFDAVCAWYAEPGFQGCAVVNACVDTRGDLSGVADIARRHLQRYVQLFETELVAMGVGDPVGLARQLLILLEGATVVAAVEGTPDAGHRARHVVEALLDSAASGGGRIPGRSRQPERDGTDQTAAGEIKPAARPAH